MARRILSPQGAVWRAALALAGISVLVGAGCGVSESGNADRGRQLFISKCGTCHMMAQAATTGTQGPNLDAAFSQARAVGMDPDTIAGVVKAQVDNPRPTTSNPSTSMPAHLVDGHRPGRRRHVRLQGAGVPGIKPPTFAGGPGGQVFGQNGCGSCHTMKAAGATGTVGPDLDKVLAGMSTAEIKQSIVDPNAKTTPGYPSGTMPQNFGQTISAQDLNTLIKFLQQSAGNGK